MAYDDPPITRLIALLEERRDEQTFQEAKQAIEAALAEGEDPQLLFQYGYIHQSRGWTAFREAVRNYERSLELDPTNEKAHQQLISAYAGLNQVDKAIELYKTRLTAAPESVIEYRFLTTAYLLAGEYEQAERVIEAGLTLAENDPSLLESRGSVLERQGHSEEALTTWKQVFELDPERGVGPRYSRVFLLRRLGRLEEAAAEWEAIIAWLLERGYTIEAEWPKRELDCVRRLTAEAEPTVPSSD